MYTENLTGEQIEMALLNPSPGVEETVRGLLAEMDSDARICVLPEGPQTIPYVQA